MSNLILLPIHFIFYVKFYIKFCYVKTLEMVYSIFSFIEIISWFISEKKYISIENKLQTFQRIEENDV